MFKITEIAITGFWGKLTAATSFNDTVNIIIGKNGSGKTTFMNVLYAVLSVDPDGLYENEFAEVRIKLTDGRRTRTITATRAEEETTPFPIVTYYISNHKYTLPIVVGDEVRSYPMSYRRRAVEESAKIRGVLSELVQLASLSVYRFRLDPDSDARGERGRRAQLSPVDLTLQQLSQRLTMYQFELSQEARQISDELQKNVLVSLLYNPDEKKAAKKGYSLKFSAEQERARLLSAYRQLGLSGQDITTRIQKHISAIAATIKAVEGEDKIDFAPLEARERTTQVIEMSLDAEKRTDTVFAQVNAFLKTLRSFIPDKQFTFEAGELAVAGESTPIPLPKLSSGEKQLLILLAEALLQKQCPYIFLADEPELSLHISWQRQIISAIVNLNPNAQIIVATHSPEIAAKFSDEIIDMEDVLHG
jgi:ABC-type lipoprotein export system ATPase subunit